MKAISFLQMATCQWRHLYWGPMATCTARRSKAAARPRTATLWATARFTESHCRGSVSCIHLPAGLTAAAASMMAPNPKPRWCKAATAIFMARQQMAAPTWILTASAAALYSRLRPMAHSSRFMPSLAAATGCIRSHRWFRDRMGISTAPPRAEAPTKAGPFFRSRPPAR